MVIVTVSPPGGKADPAAIVPDKLTDAVPNGIACDDGRATNAVVPFATVSVKDCGVEATVLAAVNVTWEMPAVVGVPPRMPVRVLNVTPGGKAAALIVGVGKPVAVTTNVPAEPTVNVVLAALVNDGAEFA